MEKIKAFMDSEKGKDILVVIIVILVGLGSFKLGRLSKENLSAGIKVLSNEAEGYKEVEQLPTVNNITGLEANVSSAINSNNPTKKFFASNRGSKYYSIGCSAGKSIKQENRVYFTTSEEAAKAGYALSSSCK